MKGVSLSLVEFLSISKATVFKDNSRLLVHCLRKSLFQIFWIHWQCQEQSTEQNLQPHFLSWKAKFRVASGWGSLRFIFLPHWRLVVLTTATSHLRVFWRECDSGSVAASTEFPHILFCQIFLRLHPPSESNSWSLGVTSPFTTGSEHFLGLHPEKNHCMGEGNPLGVTATAPAKGLWES